MTLIAGADATPADTAMIEAWLAQHRPDVTAEVHHGGQPLYAYYVRRRVATCGSDRAAADARATSSTLPVERLKGIGPKREKAFAELGITTVLDLLTHYPRRYIDRTKEATIAELAPGEEGMVLATVDKVLGAG